MATAKKHFYSIYDNMEFPDYEFREFPKAISAPWDPLTQVIVENKEEELAALQRLQAEHEVKLAGAVPQLSPEELKAQLRAEIMAEMEAEAQAKAPTKTPPKIA